MRGIVEADVSHRTVFASFTTCHARLYRQEVNFQLQNDEEVNITFNKEQNEGFKRLTLYLRDQSVIFL